LSTSNQRGTLKTILEIVFNKNIGTVLKAMNLVDSLIYFRRIKERKSRNWISKLYRKYLIWIYPKKQKKKEYWKFLDWSALVFASMNGESLLESGKKAREGLRETAFDKQRILTRTIRKLIFYMLHFFQFFVICLFIAGQKFDQHVYTFLVLSIVFICSFLGSTLLLCYAIAGISFCQIVFHFYDPKRNNCVDECAEQMDRILEDKKEDSETKRVHKK